MALPQKSCCPKSRGFCLKSLSTVSFKINATTEAPKQPYTLDQDVPLLAYNEEWFRRHYHKRSNVETTFS